MSSIDHPNRIRTTHIPVSSYSVGPYYFLKAAPRGEVVTDDNSEWWVSKDNEWLHTAPFATLEQAMRYAARPTR